MEFRRIEVKRTLRHIELVTGNPQVREVLQAVLKNDLKFTARIGGVGVMKECSVTSLADDHADIFSRSPQKVRLSPKFSEIDMIEVESNSNFIAEERDEGGRWANLI